MARGDWALAEEKLKALIHQDLTYPQAIVMLEKAKRERKLAALYAEGLERYNAGDWQEALALLSEIAATAGGYQEVDTLIPLIQGKIADAQREREIAAERERERERKRQVAAEQERRQQELATLYAEGLARYRAGDWSEALVLLGKVAATAGGYQEVDTLIPLIQGKIADAQREHERTVWHERERLVASPLSSQEATSRASGAIGQINHPVSSLTQSGRPHGNLTTDATTDFSRAERARTTDRQPTKPQLTMSELASSNVGTLEFAPPVSPTRPRLLLIPLLVIGIVVVLISIGVRSLLFDKRGTLDKPSATVATGATSTIPIVPFFTFTGHDNTVFSVAFSSDGNTLASGSQITQSNCGMLRVGR